MFIPVPDGSPQQLSSSKINATTYKVTWGAVPKDLANGVITKYEVNRTLVRVGKDAIHNEHRTFVVTSNVFHHVLHGLQLCAEYNVSFRAYTSKGSGSYSQPVSIITQSRC